MHGNLLSYYNWRRGRTSGRTDHADLARTRRGSRPTCSSCCRATASRRTPWHRCRVRRRSRRVVRLHRATTSSAWNTISRQMTFAKRTSEGPFLLNAVGASTYRLIRTLVSPDKVTDVSFEEIVEKAKTHFNPKPSLA